MKNVVEYVTSFIKANANRFKNETSEETMDGKIGYCRVRKGCGEYYMRPSVFNEELLKNNSKKEFFNAVKESNILITLLSDNGRHNSIMRRFDGKTERYIGFRFENGLFEVVAPKRRRVYIGRTEVPKKVEEKKPSVVHKKVEASPVIRKRVEDNDVITPKMRNDIFECMFGGFRCSEIANILNLSEKIVKRVMNSIN